MQTEEQAEAIRVKAMERFQEEPQELDLERLDARKLVQELRIHQIELEIQNEELRQAQQRVAEVAECYSDLYDFAPVGYLTVDKNTAIRQMNLTAAVMLGVGRERLIGKPLSTRVPAAHHTALNTHIRAVLAHKEPAPCEIEIVCPDGRQLWVSIASSLVSARNEPSLCRVTLTDITALKRIERALRESEEKHRLIADNTVDCIWQMNMDLQFVYVNAAVTSLLGYRPNEWVGTRLSDHCPPGELKRMRAAIAAASALDGSGDAIVFEANIFHRDGHLIPFEIMGKVFFGRGREPLGLQGVARDISERRRAEEEIRKFKMLAESASYGVIITDLAGKITYSNAAFACLHGAEVEEMIGSDLSSLQPDRKWSPVHAAESGAREYEEFGAREMVHRRRDGTEFDVLLNCTLVRDEAGSASFLAVTAMDITELKSLEAQLRQAQKMDAIGKLVGGVAHDFNNLLTIIVNRADFIQEALPGSSPSRSDAEEIAEAGMRGAALIRQLLAFSRRQHLNMRHLDVNDILRGVEKMLHRLIGEDIALTLELTDESCTICADAGQLEQVFLNLAVNARDAMPKGGLLTIATQRISLRPEDVANVLETERPQAGHYLAISLSDTGRGMDPATQAQIFDPFFTTKDVGQGTGLGLSTVHGIVTQHKGFIQVYSELDKGTTFRISLPVQETLADGGDAKVRSVPLPRGSESILLVDDETGVRRVSARMLHDLGYQVVEAKDGVEALQRLETRRGEISLLLTDVVMPAMDGKELAARAIALMPGLKVIFTSGYPEAHLKQRDVWVEHGRLLQKPFFMSELAHSVREVLDG